MTLTVHGLLHVADTIERIGPVWAWWSFPIERQCGRLQRYITSRRHPFANLDSHITLANQFKMAKLIYNIVDEDLSLDRPTKKKPGFELHDECMRSLCMMCETCLMLHGSDEGITLHANVRKGLEKDGDYSNAIKSCLFTRFGLKHKKTRDRFWECLPATFEVYKQATIANGDRVRAADHQGQVEDGTDRRDATFVRVSDCRTSQSPIVQPYPHSTRSSRTSTNTYQVGNRCSEAPSTLGN